MRAFSRCPVAEGRELHFAPPRCTQSLGYLDVAQELEVIDREQPLRRPGWPKTKSSSPSARALLRSIAGNAPDEAA